MSWEGFNVARGIRPAPADRDEMRRERRELRMRRGRTLHATYAEHRAVVRQQRRAAVAHDLLMDVVEQLAQRDSGPQPHGFEATLLGEGGAMPVFGFRHAIGVAEERVPDLERALQARIA